MSKREGSSLTKTIAIFGAVLLFIGIFGIWGFQLRSIFAGGLLNDVQAEFDSNYSRVRDQIDSVSDQGFAETDLGSLIESAISQIEIPESDAEEDPPDIQPEIDSAKVIIFDRIAERLLEGEDERDEGAELGENN
jgi:hypothetical protein